MKNILIVAMREFRQIASMRSFWLTLLILPLAMAMGPLAQRFFNDDEPARVMVIDRSGGSTARSLEQRFGTEQDRKQLQDLSRYVRRHKLEAADPNAIWAQHDRWYSDADIAAFRASGGLPAAMERIGRVKSPDTPEFSAPPAALTFVPTPAAIAQVPDAGLDQPLQKYLTPAEDDKAEPIDYVLLVPADFGASPVVRLWARSQPDPQFVSTVQDVLTSDLRTRMLTAQGLSPQAAQAASSVAPALAVSTPPPGGGAREAMLVRSILPLFASYLLMMSLMLSGSWMLQGIVEERSNKLLETVLACLSPEQLMYGKLLGTIAVGLSMVAAWVACGLFAGFMTQGAIADLIRPALAPLTSPGSIAVLIYFFVVGYISHSVIFLAIGAMSESMREAQGYLMPVLLAVILPITVLLQLIIAGGGGIIIDILTWVPFWTPFTVLARLGVGIPTWQVLGSGLILGLFTAIQLVLLGRLFRASLLAQGQRPGLREVVARMRGRGQAEA